MSDWRQQAICRNTDPDLFFPDNRYGRGDVQIRAAKRLCKACPVAVECLAEAFAEHDAHAIRGGLTAEERFKRRPKTRSYQSEAPCGTEAAERRHKARGETVDAACAQAGRLSRARRDREHRARKQQKAATV